MEKNILALDLTLVQNATQLVCVLILLECAALAILLMQVVVIVSNYLNNVLMKIVVFIVQNLTLVLKEQKLARQLALFIMETVLMALVILMAILLFAIKLAIIFIGRLIKAKQAVLIVHF